MAMRPRTLRLQVRRAVGRECVVEVQVEDMELELGQQIQVILGPFQFLGLEQLEQHIIGLIKVEAVEMQHNLR